MRNPAPLPPPSIDGLLHDELFGTPSTRISADDIFALSDDMRFLRVDIADELINKGARQGLFDSLLCQRPAQARIRYAGHAQRCADIRRAGGELPVDGDHDCAAFANELGLPVRYQNAVASEAWSRDGDIHYFIGHVNLTLGIRAADNVMFGRAASDQMTIDFLPRRKHAACPRGSSKKQRSSPCT